MDPHHKTNVFKAKSLNFLKDMEKGVLIPWYCW